MQYYNLIETDRDTTPEEMTLYIKDGKYYTLNCGDMISTLAADRKTILYNDQIEGVVAAESEEEAAEKLGATKVDNETSK